jgi:hypothetical protein
MARSHIKVGVIPKFPAQVIAGDGISIEQSGGVYTFSITAQPASAVGIDLNAAPYNCGPDQTSTENRDAIAQAIDDAPVCAKLIWRGAITVAPGALAYIYSEKALSFEGHGWDSAIVPDPAIASTVPVIWVKGVASGENFFHTTFRSFQIGRPYGGDREGGAGIRVQANAAGAGTENSWMEDLFIAGGKYLTGSYAVELIHDTASGFGPIYNYTINRCEMKGGIKGDRVADSVRICQSLFWGDNAIDIHCRPTEGKFTFDQNNVSTAAGFRLRGANAASITRNIFTQQVLGTGAFNALIDLAGDLDAITNVELDGNRIHKEAVDQFASPLTTRLVRVGNVAGMMFSHNDVANPVADIPIELTASSSGVQIGLNTWTLTGDVDRWVNNSVNPVLENGLMVGVPAGNTDRAVTLNATQTLANKTLTSPVINGGTAHLLTGFSLANNGFRHALASGGTLTANRTYTVHLNDGDRTLNLGGNLLISAGAGSLEFTSSGTTSVAVPASGTLATLAGAEAFSNKTSLGLSSSATINWNGDTFLSRPGAAQIQFGAADAASPVAQTVTAQGVAAGTANTAGVNLNIAGGRSTGSAAGGGVLLRVSPAGGAGSAQNTYATKFILTGTGAIGMGTETNPQFVNGLTISANAATGLAPVAGASLLLANADTVQTVLSLASWGVDNGNVLSFYNANGTAGTPTDTPTGRTIGIFGFSGRANAALVSNAARIHGVTTAAWGAAENGIKLVFDTTPTGSTTRATAATIHASGGLAVGASTADPGIGAVGASGSIHAHSGTAVPAGGTAGAGLKLSSTSNLGVFFGSGAPTLSAAQGSLYIRTDGSSTSTRLYVNTNGTTGWTNVTTAA